MRSARANDYWRKVYKRKYPTHLQKIELNGLNGIDSVTIPQGIFAICGLNGAGKSTIISAIKDVIGIEPSEYDKHKLNGAVIKATYCKSDKMYNCSNTAGERLFDTGVTPDQICYLDCTLNSFVQNRILNLHDLEDVLDQYEEFELTANEVQELNHIVGKHYTSCMVKIIENEDGKDSIPYCKVTINDVTYDSRGMGSGEHFIFYIYLMVKDIKPESILIIEEPETYISIASQIRLIDFLAKQVAEKGISVIISTHSPYILKKIRNENIRMVSRLTNTVRITTPEPTSTERILGLTSSVKGTFFVEDEIAYAFLSVCLEDLLPSILREYTIDVVGGEAEITTRLQFPKSDKIEYKFIGIYDGDMRSTHNGLQNLQWPHCFLPGDKPLEELFISFCEKQEGLSVLSRNLQKEETELFEIASALEGTDYHDWFIEFCKMLRIDCKSLVRAFYYSMKDNDLKPNDFIEELTKCCDT